MMLNNYWDWSFPYFTAQIANFFGGAFKTSWNSFDLGQASSYASNFYLNFVLSLLSHLKFLKSETILLLILLLLLVFVVLAARKLVDMKDRYIFILLLVLNPAIYYKLLAGHLDYYISYLFFIYLIYYLLRKYRPNFSSAILLGLILAFIGVQIQFHIFALITLILFFACNREKFSLKYLSLSYLIVFLVNLPWFSNFLIRATHVSGASSHAGSESFLAEMFASPIRIVTMVFSNATNIQYIYSRSFLIFYGLVTLAIIFASLYYLFFLRKKTEIVPKEEDRKIVFLMFCWLIFFCLGTGYFQKVPIPLVNAIYPMFREIGHFAPMVLLFEFLTFAFIFPYLPLKKVFQYGIFAIILVFLGSNTYYFVKYLPVINYGLARSDFQSFLDFGSSDNSSFRVLSYPFWNQYGFIAQPSVVKDGKLISNSGWDSFMGYSGKEYLSNYAYGGSSVNNTLQYNLLNNFDIKPLEERNVKYIYDFSKFYESNFEKYTSVENYDWNLALIKNDPEFENKILAANPGKISKVADGILKLNQTLPRISGQNVTFAKINDTEYKIEIKNLSDSTALLFTNNFDKNWKLYLDKPNSLSCTNSQAENGATECLDSGKFMSGDEFVNYFRKPIFEDTHSQTLGYANAWVLNKDTIASFGSDFYNQNSDGSINLSLTLYFKPQTPFLASLFLSILTLFLSIGYLVYTIKHKKRNHDAK
ncbi:MAG: hypothetical protein NTW50_02885 [Candidatus Berkelbacteria bacterium]|nr:hypothetical protein [Candidatus Berkelbacteria bacterium]